MYTVMVSDDGMFTAEYVQPPALSIPLGISGSSVEVRRNEDLTFSAMINGEWVMITAETTVTAANGNVYAAVLSREGIPIGVMHVAAMQEVMLGALGGTVTVKQAENMTWWIGEMEVKDGTPYTAANGNVYVLMMDAEGAWSAMYQQVMVTVALGTQGSVELVRAEDMSWWLGSEGVGVGSEVMSDNGNTYTLWYTDGVWTARFEPESMMIEGTGLVAMTREADDMYDVNGSTLPANGVGDVTVGGAMYHVWMQDGALMGARFGMAIHGDSDDPAFAIVGDLKPGVDPADPTGTVGTDMLPTLSTDNEDTVANEANTMLEIGGHSFSMAALLDAGMAQAMGDNFVAAATGEIEKARGDVAALLGLADEPPGLSGLLTSAWARVQTQVDKIFGSGVVDLGTRPREDDLLDEIDDILGSLSSGTAFAEATMEDGGGVFESAKLSEANALKAFDASSAEATVIFGSTGVTRYGAVSVMERSLATADADYNAGNDGADPPVALADPIGNGQPNEMGLVGAFSYSTIDDVQRVFHIQTSGTAYYEGGTTSVSGDGTLYTGDIALEIRFSSNRVSGLVTNLQSTAGEAWTYQYGAVESIILSPATNLNNNAHWSRMDPADSSSNTARVTFAPRAGSPLPSQVRGSFQGQLLGRGDDSGNHAQGTWSVGTQTAGGSSAYMAGAFGAARTDDGSPTRPGTDNGAVHETVVTSNDGVAEASLPNAFKLDGGDLVVTMNRYGRYLEATASTTVNNPPNTDIDGDGTADATRTVLGAATSAPAGSGAVSAVAGDQLFVLDSDLTTSDLENVTHDLKQSLANMVANAQTDRNVNGPAKQIALVVREIEAARGDLAVLQELDSRNTALEQAAWRKVQGALLRIFHHVPPKLADSYDDDDALGLIDQALDAFASSGNLAAALDRDGRGIFNDVTTNDGIAEPDAGLIWGRQEVQMKTHGGATDYTRWGVWRVRTDRYAARNAWTQPNDADTNGNAPGTFAYSQLLPTKWADEADPGFPAGGRATFVGGTTGIVNTAFYDGDVSVIAEWDATWDGTNADALGTLSVRITNLANADGDPLLQAPDTPFYAIVFSGVNIHSNASNEVVFISAGDGGDIAASGTFTGLTGTQGLTEGTLTASTRGKFVGQDIEGPLGVIGTYSIDAAGINGTRPLLGSFGAERP